MSALLLLSPVASGRSFRYITFHHVPPPVTQATHTAYPLEVIRRLKDVVADAIVEHVTVGLAKGVGQLREQCAHEGGRVLHLIEGARARTMGFEVFDSLSKRKKLPVFEAELHRRFLTDYEYMPLTVMGAAADAIKAGIVVWVQHPEYADHLVVHREYQVRFSAVASHVPHHSCPQPCKH